MLKSNIFTNQVTISVPLWGNKIFIFQKCFYIKKIFFQMRIENMWKLKTCYVKENGISAENIVEMEVNNNGKKTKVALIEYWQRD